MVTKTPKEIIKSLLETALTNASHDLNRAKAVFKGYDLNEQYGKSGQTRLQILNDYQHQVDNLKNTAMWLNTIY